MSGIGRLPSSAVNSAQYQPMPSALTPVVNIGGKTLTTAWYQFLNNLWTKVSSGCPNTITLQTTWDNAQDAQEYAGVANDAVDAEVSRAKAAEANLQGEINTTNANLSAQIGSINSQINALHTTDTNLQNQINVINSRLAAAGIP